MQHQDNTGNRFYFPRYHSFIIFRQQLSGQNENKKPKTKWRHNDFE